MQPEVGLEGCKEGNGPLQSCCTDPGTFGIAEIALVLLRHNSKAFHGAQSTLLRLRFIAGCGLKAIATLLKLDMAESDQSLNWVLPGHPMYTTLMEIGKHL